jgi:hypothetical protein
MHKSSLRATTAILSGMVMAAALLWLGAAATVQAIVEGATRYVATTGSDTSNNCTNPSQPCATIQHAIDQAIAGDDIRIAGGKYTRAGTVAAIDKQLTITGTYAPDFSGYDPELYETILDAQWGGSVISMTNAGDVTLMHLSLTRGDGAGNCGSIGCGGGVYSKDTNLHLGRCTVENNVGNSSGRGEGGGIYAYNGDHTIWKNHIASNTANADSSSSDYGAGGGIYIQFGTASLTENVIADNLGNSWYGGDGGGISLNNLSHAAVLTNVITGNNANATGSIYGSYGGGIYTHMVLSGNIAGNKVENNLCNGGGGGIQVNYSDIHVTRNTIVSNTARSGGGAHIQGTTLVTLSNNLVAHNQAVAWVGGIFVTESYTPTGKSLIVNNTIFENEDSGIGVWGYVVMTMTNNLIAGNGKGIGTPGPFTGTITADHNLFWNSADPISGTNPVLANPKLTPHYHLRDGSPALDAGLTIPWLTIDLDGEIRPEHGAYDIGAYEGAWWDISLPLVLRKH